MIGVYKIITTHNGKVYIGSSIEVQNRWSGHKTAFIHGKGNVFLRDVFNVYGEGDFEFAVLEECNQANLLEREKYYIDLYKSNNRDYGYNIAPVSGKRRTKPLRIEEVKESSPTEYINTEELCTLLGISGNTAYAWRKLGIIPYIQVTRKTIKYDKQKIMEWMDSNKN